MSSYSTPWSRLSFLGNGPAPRRVVRGSCPDARPFRCSRRTSLAQLGIARQGMRRFLHRPVLLDLLGTITNSVSHARRRQGLKKANSSRKRHCFPPRSAIEWVLAIMNEDERRRINEALLCADADYIPKVPDAGKVRVDEKGDRVQVMHNGLLIAADGY